MVNWFWSGEINIMPGKLKYNDILNRVSIIRSCCLKNCWELPWWCRGEESTCQCRGDGLDPWAGSIPHDLGQWIPCTKLLILSSKSRELGILTPNPQLLKPTTPGARGPQQGKPPQGEARAVQLESRPCLLLVEKARTATEAQESQKYTH